MTMRLAADNGPICAEGQLSGWLCRWTLERTDNVVFAQFANLAGTMARVVAVIVVAFFVSRFLRRSISRFAQRMERTIETRLQQAHLRGAIPGPHRYRTRRLQRLQAIVGVLRGVVAGVVWITAILVILHQLDVRLQPVLAGAGLVGVVVGFGAQQLVRDVLAGIAMLIEDQYGVGDWIEVDGKMGEVERVGLRSTAFRDLDGVVHHVLNGSIQRVGNLSQHWARSTFDVPLALDADVPAAKALIHKVASDLAADPLWGQDIIGPPEVWGVQDFGPQGLKIRLVIPTKPLRNWDITRQLRERIKFAFDHANIRMPGQLVDLGGRHAGYPVAFNVPGPMPGESATPDRPTVADMGDDAVQPTPSTAPHPGDAGAPTTEVAEPGDGSAPAETVIQKPVVTAPRTAEEPDEPGESERDRDVTDQLRFDRGPQPRPD